MASAAFTSYSSTRSDAADERWVVEKLEALIAGELGVAAGDDVCFFAPQDIRSGEDWRNRVLDEANNARALVLLCSRKLFFSEWCAMEFDIFHRRWSETGDHEPVIFPVLMYAHGLPAAIKRFQVSSPSTEKVIKKYLSNGLLGLPKKHRKIVLAEIARSVAAAIRKDATPPLDPPPALDDLRRSFDIEGSPVVHVALLHDDGCSWKLDRFNDTVAYALGNATAGVSSALGFRVANRCAPDSVAPKDLVVVVLDGSQAQRWSSALQAATEGAARAVVFVAGDPAATEGGWRHVDATAAGLEALRRQFVNEVKDFVYARPATQIASPQGHASAHLRGVRIDRAPTMTTERPEPRP